MNDTLDNELKEIEAHLANLSPIEMPNDMIYRMELAMISWADNQLSEEKIVPFNKFGHSNPTTASNKNNNHLNLWGAVAAIALMTGVAATFMTGNSQDEPEITNIVSPSPAAVTSAIPVQERLANNSLPKLSRNITHASNEGITYAGKNEAPFKVLRIEYTEKVITVDKDGKEVITKKPCIEHILVPVPVH